MRGKIQRDLRVMLLVTGCLLLPGLAVAAPSKVEIIAAGQTVYVPVYSHIFSGDRESPFYLAVTLSIRNTDPKHSINILSVDYYDSKGKLVRAYLKEPITLGPLSSTHYMIKESDKSGGSGANFLVIWKADVEVNAPVIESVMIGTKTQQGISFTSPGRVIRP